METPTQIIQIFGFFAILAGAAVLFVRLVQVLVGGKVHRLRIYLELLAILTVAYPFAAPAAHFVGLEETGREVFAQGSAGRYRQQVGDSHTLECVDVRPVVDFRRRYPMTATVPRVLFC